MAFEITSWKDIRQVAPDGAVGFRYRKPTGVRRKFYESGRLFSLDEDGDDLTDRGPSVTTGMWSVHFYTREEAAKPIDEAAPMIIEPPECDELLVQFPQGVEAGAPSEKLIIRELLNVNKDMAKAAVGPAEASIKLLKRVSHERDVMAEELEKNRFGVVGLVVLENMPAITAILKAAAPAISALALTLLERAKKDTLGDQIAELRKEVARLAAVASHPPVAQKRTNRAPPRQKKKALAVARPVSANKRSKPKPKRPRK